MSVFRAIPSHALFDRDDKKLDYSQIKAHGVAIRRWIKRRPGVRPPFWKISAALSLLESGAKGSYADFASIESRSFR
jgi:hypothetical protein